MRIFTWSVLVEVNVESHFGHKASLEGAHLVKKKSSFMFREKQFYAHIKQQLTSPPPTTAIFVSEAFFFFIIFLLSGVGILKKSSSSSDDERISTSLPLNENDHIGFFGSLVFGRRFQSECLFGRLSLNRLESSKTTANRLELVFPYRPKFI